jgi:hypothetical protein
MLSVIMLGVRILSVLVLSFLMLSVFILSVVEPVLCQEVNKIGLMEMEKNERDMQDI